MKKAIATAAAALGIVSTLAAAGTIYPTTMEITKIRNDIVTLETATGHIYEMEGAEDYMEGDLVSLIMFSNGTEDVRDDIIITARYSGYYID